MKYYALVALLLLLVGCGVITQKGGISYATLKRSDLPNATIKYTNEGKDSLRVSFQGNRFSVVIPYSDIRFKVIQKTTEDILLTSFDETKILIFCIKNRAWSQLKNRTD